jgi:hypothetical protein
MPKWVKGQSGNPGGRPKGAYDLQERARRHVNLALEALIEVASNKEAPPAARVSAASVLLDRGFGKPLQTTHSTITKVDLDKWTDGELAEYLTALGDQPNTEAETDSERLN